MGDDPCLSNEKSSEFIVLFKQLARQGQGVKTVKRLAYQCRLAQCPGIKDVWVASFSW